MPRDSRIKLGGVRSRAWIRYISLNVNQYVNRPISLTVYTNQPFWPNPTEREIRGLHGVLCHLFVSVGVESLHWFFAPNRDAQGRASLDFVGCNMISRLVLLAGLDASLAPLFERASEWMFSGMFLLMLPLLLKYRGQRANSMPLCIRRPVLFAASAPLAWATSNVSAEIDRWRITSGCDPSSPARFPENTF